jgi:hypothetical protein
MDWSAFTDALISTQSPWLPDPAFMRWGRSLAWGLVLAALAAGMLGRYTRRVRLGAAAALLAWCLLPGIMSPSFWLSLAFQAPSLTSAALGLLVLWRLTQAHAVTALEPAPGDALAPAAWAGIVLGGVLLLDTFALLPFSFYATGFGPAAMVLTALLVSAPWVIGASRPLRRASMLMAAVLLLFVTLRLPSGNLWDALIDPWLWLGLLLLELLRAWRRFSLARSGSAATRA